MLLFFITRWINVFSVASFSFKYLVFCGIYGAYYGFSFIIRVTRPSLICNCIQMHTLSLFHKRTYTHTHICKYVHILLLSFGVFMANCTALLVVVSAVAASVVVGTCVSSCSRVSSCRTFSKYIGSIVSTKKKYI